MIPASELQRVITFKLNVFFFKFDVNFETASLQFKTHVLGKYDKKSNGDETAAPLGLGVSGQQLIDRAGGQHTGRGLHAHRPHSCRLRQ
jgi:hypothetical protein